MPAPRPERVLAFPDALATVLTHARALRPPARQETVPLHQAAGRVLAQAIHADRDQPPFHRSTRDGFAVRTADLGSALRLIGSLRAGQVPTGPPLGVGEALEIMTGAPVPPMADAVLMFEHAVVSGDPATGDFVQLAEGRTLTPGENIVPRASEARAGAELIPAGRRLAAPEIALAASCGLPSLTVYAPPRVAIIATGDELVELVELVEFAELGGPNPPRNPGPTPEPWQIRNSNSYALAALVRETGAQPVQLAIARDTLADIGARMEQARTADLLLLSGGVSMGKYDLVEEVLAAHRAEFLFTGTLIQPGKPLVFGRLPKGSEQQAANSEQPTTGREQPTTDNRQLRTGEDTRRADNSGCLGSGFSDPGLQDASRQPPIPPWQYFFGLPGNPVSTEVCFRLFVAPLLRALAGQTDLAPRFVEARLSAGVRGGARVTRFLPALLTADWQSATVELVPWQGSGDLAANARANCFAVLPTGPETFPAGETIRVLLR